MQVQIGHDGQGPGSGWYLKTVTVKETFDAEEKYVFICEKYDFIIMIVQKKKIYYLTNINYNSLRSFQDVDIFVVFFVNSCFT